MVTTLRQGLTTFPTTVSGGTIPDDSLIVDVSQWAEALEPRKTPLQTWIGFGPASDMRPHYWGQSYRVGLESNLAESGFDSSETDLTVTSGTGKLFQKWSVIEVVDFKSGSSTILDQSTKEIMLVTTSPAADVLTVVRAQGGTSGVAHTNGAKIRIIGTAEPQLNNHSISPIARGTRAYNNFQRFAGGVQADKAARNMKTWEHKTDPMLADFEEEQLRQKVLLEEALWNGGRQSGDVATPLPAMMGNIGTYLVTNVTNMANAKLTLRVLEAELRDLAKNTDGGPEGIKLLMSYNTAAIFDLVIDQIRRATVSDSSVSLFVDAVKFRFGTYDIAVSHSCPDGQIWGVRKECMKIIPFKGLNWHVGKKDGQVHGQDYDEMYVSGDFTLEVIKEASMFKMYNFNEDLDMYDSPFAA